ncbi:endonuclease/exonuclease/phosphatase family protein [Streptomyces sp. NPDC052236]|uniref:endonuclease/exonuclease/phosphatase family protein n=1 Tax=Streptomyces sp. NPDC052236 TaxID=3365686 RepID=UPI0037D6091D
MNTRLKDLRTAALFAATVALLSLTVLPGNASVPEGAPRAAPAGNGQLVGTFNIYGNKGHQGNGGKWIKNEADAIKDIVLDDTSRWFFIALQETCKNQGEQFAQELGMKSAFVATGPKCANEEPYGNTLLYHSGRVLPSALLPNPADKEGRGIICAALRTKGDPSTEVAACSTHLSVDSAANRAAQVKFINSDMNDGSDYQPEGRPLFAYGSVIIGGDFNALPRAAEMDSMYAGIEANGPRTAQIPQIYPTTDDGRKIDYLFTWDMRGPGSWDALATGVQDSSNSDHHLYYSKFSRG